MLSVQQVTSLMTMEKLTFLGSYNFFLVALFGMLVFPCVPKEIQEQRQGPKQAKLFRKHECKKRYQQTTISNP